MSKFEINLINLRRNYTYNTHTLRDVLYPKTATYRHMRLSYSYSFIQTWANVQLEVIYNLRRRIAAAVQPTLEID